MELRHLRYFIGVAEDLNFSRAAERLHIAQSALSRQVQDLEREIGFIGMPHEDLQSRLSFEVFRRDRLVVALPAGHPLAGRRTVCLADLAAERFIFLTRAGTPVYYDWLMRLCHEARFHPNIVQEVESGQTAVELVAAGTGVALFPETAQRQLHGDMSFHPLAGRVPRFEYAVAWRREDVSPALLAFLNLLRAELANKRSTARPTPPA